MPFGDEANERPVEEREEGKAQGRREAIAELRTWQEDRASPLESATGLSNQAFGWQECLGAVGRKLDAMEGGRGEDEKNHRTMDAELRAWIVDDAAHVKKATVEAGQAPALMVLQRLGWKLDELRDGPEHYVHPFVEAKHDRVARIVRNGLIGELREWQGLRLGQLEGLEGQGPSGERYGMDRLSDKLDEMEGGEGGAPEEIWRGLRIGDALAVGDQLRLAGDASGLSEVAVLTVDGEIHDYDGVGERLNLADWEILRSTPRPRTS